MLLDLKPDIVLTHWPVDTHRDHRATALLTYDAWLASKKTFALYYFEVMTGTQTQLFRPTHYVDITSVDARKAATRSSRTRAGVDPLRTFREDQHAGKHEPVPAAWSTESKYAEVLNVTRQSRRRGFSRLGGGKQNVRKRAGGKELPALTTRLNHFNRRRYGLSMDCWSGLRKSRMTRLAFAACAVLAPCAKAAQPIDDFRKTVQPLLSQYCYDCHADGVNKGKVALDQFKSDQDIENNRELWWRVLKNVRCGIMPPQKRERPTAAERTQLAEWIKYDAFGIDRSAPDPGRVTIRRLNRVEYRNTIRDLMGVDYNTTDEFPPDDTGYGFDTIGDVLSVSPMLLEKYMQAAEKIVADAVPTIPRMVAETEIPGTHFRTASGGNKLARFSFYQEADVSAKHRVKFDGDYRVVLNVGIIGQFDYDPGTCTLVFKVDGEEKWRQDLRWQNRKQIRVELAQKWRAGQHELSFEIHPTTPPEKKKGGVDVIITSVSVQGPLDGKYWVPTKNFGRFFPRESAPSGASERRAYSRQVLAVFAKKAFRRPPEDRVIQKLVEIAEAGYTQSGKSFEDGIKQAMVAVLSSPRFLFRVEGVVPGHEAETSSPIDEWALASRLSYFLWSTMPDQELFALADRSERQEPVPQIRRMLGDPRSQALIDNFVGQWLELRDVEGININVRTVLRQDSQALRNPTTEPARGALASSSTTITARLFGRTNLQLDTQLRLALRQEPEMLFGEIISEDRSISELIDTDHTYLNEKLATLYKITGVQGTEMRRVELPKDSPRGGLLTMGAVLIVTSNSRGRRRSNAGSSF